MSYDSSTSTPSSSTQRRVSGADEKDQEVESQGLNPQKTSGGANVTNHGQGSGAGGCSSPDGGSRSGGLSGDQRGSNSDDMDGLSSGNDSGERENGSCRHQSSRSFRSHGSSNGKDSGMMLETTESNKR